MDPKIFDFLSTFPAPISSIIFVTIVIIALVKFIDGAPQSIRSLIGLIPSRWRRQSQLDEMKFVSAQLQDSTLPGSVKGILETRRKELIVAITRGIDLPWIIQEQIIEVSIDKNPHGFMWWQLRKIQDRFRLKEGILKVEYTQQDTSEMIRDAVSSLLSFILIWTVCSNLSLVPTSLQTPDLLLIIFIVLTVLIALCVLFLTSALNLFVIRIMARQIEELVMEKTAKKQ